MKKFKRVLSISLIVVFTFYAGLSNITAMAITSKAITAKAKEVKTLVSRAAAAQAAAKKKAVSAKTRELSANKNYKTAINNVAIAVSLEAKILAANSLGAETTAVSRAKEARVLADKELAVSINAYKLAIKAKVATDKIGKAKTAKARTAAVKPADTAIKAVKTENAKVLKATKLSSAAVVRAIAATKVAKAEADKVAAEKAAVRAAEKAAAEKAAAEKAAAEKAAAEKAAAEKAAAEKAAAEKAAAEKAAAEKAAAEKAAAEKAAAEKAAAMKIIAKTIYVTSASNETIMILGRSIQMVASISPANTYDKSVRWIVAPGTGTAIIDPQTGVLTATGTGTVTVAAINPTSGITGTMVISIGVVAPTIVGASVGPGTVWGSTKITYSAASGNSLRYVKQAGAFATQIAGVNMSPIGNAYTSGNNILGASVNEHVGLFEVDSIGRIVKFKDITLVAGDIVTAANSITGYSVAQGTVAGSTRIYYTPASGNSLRYIKQSIGFVTPVVGKSVSGTTYYSSGANITGAVAGQHIGLYEVTTLNNVVRFVDITLSTSNIATNAPSITGYSIGAGTIAGSTKIIYSAGSGNTLRYVKQSGGFTIPFVGTDAGSIGFAYTSGDNIAAVSAGQHIGLYEVNNARFVVKFVDITLAVGNIAVAAATPVITSYLVEPGTVTGSTKITYTADAGDKLRYVKQSSAFATPTVGTNAASIGSEYISGTNITGATAGQHVGLYEINSAGQLVKFVDITLGAGNIAVASPAPVITGFVVEQGTVTGATKITYSAASGNSLKYLKQASAIATPLGGADVSLVGSAYTSGTNILGAAAMEHIGLYEVDGNKRVVRFVDITLGVGNIKAADPAPIISGFVVEQGSVKGATKITYSIASGNSLKYLKQAGVVSTPLVGADVSTIGSTYISGANILGAVATEHIGLYEVDGNKRVVRFVDITLGTGNIAP